MQASSTKDAKPFGVPGRLHLHDRAALGIGDRNGVAVLDHEMVDDEDVPSTRVLRVMPFALEDVTPWEPI